MKPGHKDHAVKYATIDSSGRFVATSGTDGKINGVQVVVHLSNSSSFNKTLVEEKLKNIKGIEDIVFKDPSNYGQKSSSASSLLRNHFLVFFINTFTILSISYLFSSMGYEIWC